MTFEESLNQKLAAAATLRFLAIHGSTSFQDLQHELLCYDRQTLMRGVVLAESLGGMCISIDKRQLGEVTNFGLVKVSHKVKLALTILERQTVVLRATPSRGVNERRDDEHGSGGLNLFDFPGGPFFCW